MRLTKSTLVILSLSFMIFNQFSIAKENEDESQTRRIVQFENDDVTVWKTIIMPNDPLKLHHHDKKRIVVALTDTDLKVTNDKGETKFYHWPKGTAHFLDIDKPNELHGDINETDHIMETMVIQLNK